MSSKRKRPQQESVVASKYFGAGASSYFHSSGPRKGSLPALIGPAPHTLLMGTQASDNALDGDIPFFTNENCFWHILGDALGFRRGFHMRRDEAVESIRPHLLHPLESECGYEEARCRLLEAGYAVWDVVASSERAGSLDQDIRKPRYHDVRTLCATHSSLRRICFVTGSGSAKIFRAGWKEWLATPGLFVAAPDAASQAVFGRYVRPPTTTTSRDDGGDGGGGDGGDGDGGGGDGGDGDGGGSDGSDGGGGGGGGGDVAAAPSPIELLVMESVSPAAVPAASTRSHARRVAAYRAAGRTDLIAAGAPRAAAYAWKRACWLGSSAFPDEVLHPAARAARRFGSRPTDVHGREAEAEADVDVEDAACDDAEDVEVPADEQDEHQGVEDSLSTA